MKVACFSIAAMDYFPERDAHYAGGNSLNQSVRFSDQGVHSAFLGALGNDSHGSRIHSLLVRRNVDVSQLEIIDGDTANNRIINDDTGERFGEEGAWNSGVYEEYRLSEENWNYIRGFDVWATHSDCPDFHEAIARKEKSLLCVDYLHLPDFSVLESTIENVDIAYIGGDSSMSPKLAELSKITAPLIVLTLGSEGSVAFHKGRSYVREAIISDDVLDTTGCGDAFQSAFTYSFVKNQDIHMALEAGTKMGTLAAKNYGGVNW